MGHDIGLYGKDMALSKYHQAGLDGIDIADVLHAGITPETLRDFLKDEYPDVVITGTSADDFTEKYLWNVSWELGIPSMAILDQWLNYGIRFSSYSVNDIEEYTRNPAHPFLPTRIVAPDEYAKSEMIEAGLPEERIVVCGQPYFETVLAFRQEPIAVVRFHEAYHLTSEDFVVVFASEPITTTYGDGALRYWGYNELTILSSLVQTLNDVASETARPVTLVVRPHSKEGREHFLDILGKCRNVRWIIDTDSLPWTLMNRADLVCGMSSMFLIESAILGRPVLSIQIGLCRENPFVLDRRNILKSILTEAELHAQVRKLLLGGQSAAYSFDIIRNPVQRIISEMKKLLCQYSR
jgi:predicted glycosyltransferase